MNDFTVGFALVFAAVLLLETWVQCSRGPYFRALLSADTNRGARSSADDFMHGGKRGLLARWRDHNFRLSLDDGGALMPRELEAARPYSYWATAFAGAVLLCIVMLHWTG